MAVLTGISNENEFYSHHYLSAILENDLKDVFARWRASQDGEGARLPHERLRGLSRAYFQTRAALSRERRPEDRLQAQRSFAQELLDALGYEYAPGVREADDGHLLPVLAEVRRASGAPQLWVLEAVDAADEGQDPLELKPVPVQFPDPAASNGACALDYDTLVSRQVFGRSEPPRWILLVSDRQLLLLDRGKWNEKRLLRFNLEDILGRRETSTLQAMAALLHRDSVCPADGLPLLDTLDEKSHKHAFGVSEELKYALREAIERLGNEAVHWLKQQHRGVFDRNLGEQLTVECLRWMYRLLFVFYIEARPELGYAPVRSDAYRKGYSLDSLRDLEMVDLTVDQDGYYLHDSLTLLFRLIYEGCGKQPEQMHLEQDVVHHTFTMAPLRSHLFDPERTPLLSGVRFRNSVLLRVVKLMSLSRPKGGKERPGRISYAQLGINQLGAVYEALLSFRGFFAETDLYEVRKAPKKGAAVEASSEEADVEDADAEVEEEDDEEMPARARGGKVHDALENAYFVPPEKLPQYTEDERVCDEDGRLKQYPKGTFIYRLAGRDREKSASYYTPEVLTKCLVKYALKELLEGKTADEILQMRVCEPAMGSAAFLNEAVNQLAEAYLDRKQKERGEAIPHDAYAIEKQKVKMYLADNRVFGVDLNPVAAELAEVSLWLNSIYEGAYVPWFGLQLKTGNSLVGARRQVFGDEKLGRLAKGDTSWLKSVPERVMPGAEREKGTVYHFLVPDEGMAAYKDKVIKGIAPQEIGRINDWRKGFTKPFSDGEIRHLEGFSEAVDRLWARHASELSRLRNLTTDPLQVYGQPPPSQDRPVTDTAWKDAQAEKFLSSFSPYRRLKLVMDYWCALWFWPIEKAELLPSRHEFMLEVSLILEGSVVDFESADPEQLDLFDREVRVRQQLSLPDSTAASEFGIVDTDRLCKAVPRLALVRELAERYRFLHWELEFADLFGERGGFDLVLGNPPWIKVEWNEGGVMGDHEPLFVLRKFSATQLDDLRNAVLMAPGLQGAYVTAFESAEAMQNFLNSTGNYPLLKRTQTNLYKCFLPQSWMIRRPGTVSAFLHPEGLYDDPKGGVFREEVYTRLRYHFQFVNELKLFSEIYHHAVYSINIYGELREPQFAHIANLFHPETIDQCYANTGEGQVGGIRNVSNQWNLAGHRSRVLKIASDELNLIAAVYNPEASPSFEAPLPPLHSTELLDVLRKFAAYPKHLRNLSGSYVSTEMWHETNSQRDGTIRRYTDFVMSPSEWILSGPHVYVSTPYYKTPRRVCREKSDYDAIDLTQLPTEYLPRSNYVTACSPDEFISRMPSVHWQEEAPLAHRYRVCSRRQLRPAGERTLISCLAPAGSTHIHTVNSLTFRDQPEAAACAALFASLPCDFFIKTRGKVDLYDSTLRLLPFVRSSPHLQLRALLLNCLTTHYADLWTECWNPAFAHDTWAKSDPRLSSTRFTALTQDWRWETPLRTDYERRQALVEIDLLASMALGLTLDELKTIYRVQFPVLQQNERDTWYDQRGRIVFTCSKGLPGVGFTRAEWNEIRSVTSGTVDRTITDDTLPGGPHKRTITYYAPFDRCDRERDYDTAWAEFERRY